jgi:hypothetical protein
MVMSGNFKSNLNLNNSLKYELALSVMNAMSGFCFRDLEAVRRKPSVDLLAVGRLQLEYRRLCAERDALPLKGEAVWDEVIAVSGAEVKRRVEALRLDCVV